MRRSIFASLCLKAIRSCWRCDTLLGATHSAQLVFTERYYYCTQEWRHFLEMRKDLLTRFAIQRHISYSKHQLERYIKSPKPIPGKRIYHIIRLLFAVDDMRAGRDISIWLEGERRELVVKVRLPCPELNSLCYQIRRDGFTKGEFIALATERLLSFTNSEEHAIPSELRQKIDGWLIRTRCVLLREKEASTASSSSSSP